MAQTTILAAGQTTATSSTVVVSGTPVTLSLFSAGNIPNECSFAISLLAPTGKQVLGYLVKNNPAYSIGSPGSYVVDRIITQVGGIDIGVFSET